MSSGVEASAKKALRDSAWRHLIFFLEEISSWEKRWGNKTRKLFGRPKNNGRIQKSALGKREGERTNRYYTKFCLLLPYLYSYNYLVNFHSLGEDDLYLFSRFGSWLDQPVLFLEFRISKQIRPLMLPRGVMERMVEWSKALWQNPSKSDCRILRGFLSHA